MIEIKVDDSCEGCGNCVKQCPTEVLELAGKKAQAKNLDYCMVCKLCEVVCPYRGITVTGK